MSTVNVTIDDFDSFVHYSASGAFTTPDPSKAANSSTAAYYENTFHATAVQDASVSLNFTGTGVYVFGSAAGAWDVSLDGQTQSNNGGGGGDGAVGMLYSNAGLAAGAHALTMTNRDGGGKQFLFDYALVTAQLAADGASVTNTTVEETDSKLTYTGTWGNNTDSQFSGGGTKFTNEDGATVSLTFKGSAIYMYGDTNANHGLYTVTLDSNAPLEFHGTVGCGLTYETVGVCERTTPGLSFFAAYLNDSEHTIVAKNEAGANKTFLDLDRFVYSTPSQFLPANTTASASGSGSAPSSTSSSNGSLSAAHGVQFAPMALLALVFLGMLRRAVR